MSGGVLTIAFVTPARDEAEHLPALVTDVAAQTRRPDQWVVVDDGSTDGTAVAAERAIATAGLAHAWVLRLTHDRPRSFAGKAAAFAAGRRALGEPAPDLVGCLDADLVLPPDLVARLVDAFAHDPSLGISGVRYRHPVGGRLRSDGGPPHEVPGVVQVFRREVLDAVGGYEALPHGGEDTVANARARALGWTTRVVDGVEVVQRRRQGSVAAATRVRRLARAGRCDHDLGTLPTYEVLKAVRRLGEPPVVLGATARLVAYAADAARRRPPLASPAAVAQLRAEQRALLRDWRRWRRR